MDGIDNDFDGLIDCEDPDCNTSCDEKCLPNDDFNGDVLDEKWLTNGDSTNKIRLTSSGELLFTAPPGVYLPFGLGVSGPRVYQPVEPRSDWTIITKVFAEFHESRFSEINPGIQSLGVYAITSPIATDGQVVKLIELKKGQDRIPTVQSFVQNGNASLALPYLEPNIYLKIVKEGGQIEAFYSEDGITYNSLGFPDLLLDDIYYFGLYAENDIENLTIFTPYFDYFLLEGCHETDFCASFTANATTTPEFDLQSNGTATAIPFNGIPPYTYKWNTDPEQTTKKAIGLATGAYMVTVTDSLGCEAFNSAFVTRRSTMFPQLMLDTPIICGGGCTGVASVSVSGGIPPYQFSWTNGSTDSVAMNLCAGASYVTISDSLGTEFIDSLVLIEPQALEVTTNIVNVTCSGQSDGEIYLNLSGGLPPYEIKLNGATTTDTIFTGLTQNTYEIEITDASGCTNLSTWTIRADMDSPTAAFLQSTDTFTVNFIDRSMGMPVTWQWDFGDGNNSTDSNPTHTYGSSGSYQVCLLVSNICGVDTFCQEIIITGPSSVEETFSSRLQIFPNPTTADLQVEYYLEKSTDLTLKVLNVSGAVQYSGFENEHRLSGKNSEVLQLEHLPDGIYYLQFLTPGFQKIVKVVKI